MGIVAKYKFDGSVYADLIPEFNAEFTNYTITDEVDSENSNYIIRTIESESLPTLMRFGSDLDTYVEGSEIALLEVLEMNTNGLTSCRRMFRYCKNLTSITCNWNTSNVTSMYAMFRGCPKLTSLNVSDFDTSKVTGMYGMFQDCSNLTSLDVSNFDTSKVTRMDYIFQNCSNLVSLDVSNWDVSNSLNINISLSTCNNLKYLKCNNVSILNTLSTLLPTKTSNTQGTIICKSDIASLDTTTLSSKYWTVNTNPTLIAKYKYDSKIYKNLIPVFNEGYMGFVEDEEVDGNGIVTRKIEHVELPTYMRFGETWETSQNIPTWRSSSLIELLQINDSNIANFSDMFKCCNNLRNVCKLNLSGIALVNTFFRCYNLEKLDLSNNTFSNVENINYIFSECAKLISLDISNFNLNKCRGFDNVFTNNISLKDIGMLYCDQPTINKVASLLPTDHNITIWVESDDILQYDQYDHITYKTQKVQDTVHLNSPLLMGDTIEVIDGKTYHVHRYEKVVLDGSEDEEWTSGYQGDTLFYRIILERRGSSQYDTPTHCNKIRYNVGWHNNHAHYFIDQYIYLSFVIPSITTYSQLRAWLSEDPAIVVYELETPYYELISEEPLELTLLDTADNTINNNSILPSNMTIANKELSTIAIKPSTTYTLSFDKSNVDSEVTIDICGGEQITTVLNRVELTTPSELGSGIRFISSDGCIVSNVRLLEGSLVKEAIPKETFEGLQSSFEEGYIIGENLIKDLTPVWNSTLTYVAYYQIVNIKENTNYTLINPKIYDDTYFHVYGVAIGNGTDSLLAYQSNKDNPYIRTFNTKTNTSIRVYCRLKYMDSLNLVNDPIEVNLNNNWNDLVLLEGDHTHLSEAELMRYIEKGTSHYEEEDYNHAGKYKVQYKVTGKNKFDKNKFLDLNSNYEFISQNIYKCKSIQLKPNTTYTISKKYADTNLSLVLLNVLPQVNRVPYFDLRDGSNSSKTYTTLDDGKLYIGSGYNSNLDAVLDRIQIEEGTVATEYEPYKEDIKTYYLSSPLLEGDTIEDINGVATHVKRYEKEILRGSENWYFVSGSTTEYPFAYLNRTNMVDGVARSNTLPFIRIGYQGNAYGFSCHTDVLRLRITNNDTLDSIKQWLSENPTTVVYQLASPIYEPISTESILCDSYVNGHLDVDTNIPIKKVYFDYLLLALKYIKPSTRYLLQFESDNVGVSTINIGGSTVSEVPIIKGINKVEITTLSTLNHQLLAFSGIGFNASNIQVVEANEDIEFGYFKGLQSSFEDGLVTDENDENYGKYKVECKIVGKNKFNGELEIGSITANGGLTDDTRCVRVVDYIKIKPNTAYIISNDKSYTQNIYFYDIDYNCIKTINTKNSFTTPQNCMYIKFRSNIADIQNDLSVKYQLEEGTQATSYEPYKESIHTLYLNSPLLKGDKLVVHDGKLCHYHKMGMVVLDGNNILPSNTNIVNGFLRIYMYKLDKKALYPGLNEYPNCYSNQLQTLTRNFWANFNIESVSISDAGQLTFSKKNDTLEGFKQWLQQNPTTVVYELAEPYYEPIEPQLSQYSFSTVKDGDMEIITVLPIEKINLTYRTDINGVSSIEEQIASIQEGTDISSIIDEEVDE